MLTGSVLLAEVIPFGNALVISEKQKPPKLHTIRR